MSFSKEIMVASRKLKLALYVHDLKLEIGHSNSLIELIRHLPKSYIDQFSEIDVVTFSTSPLKELFPGFEGKLTWTKVPFAKIKPVLLKSIFYQIWVYLYDSLLQSGSVFRIGIGISSLNVDAVSIQFIHHQWTKRGLELEASHGIRKIYKKILFWYFEKCESFLFRNKKIKFFSPAKFLTNFINAQFPGVDTATIYSGVNLERFLLSKSSKKELLDDLITRYPVLKGVNIEKPIYLFVGAYERKGLDEAVSLLQNHPHSQFIVIGSPSMGKTMIWPENLKVFTIPFTREISKFYSLSDVFLFPTTYEPFGLVLFEAMAMGLSIVTHRAEVGASELLEILPEVHFSDTSDFSLPGFSIKTNEDRIRLREKRLELLGNVSWSRAGNELAEYLGKY